MTIPSGTDHTSWLKLTGGKTPSRLTRTALAPVLDTERTDATSSRHWRQIPAITSPGALETLLAEIRRDHATGDLTTEGFQLIEDTLREHILELCAENHPSGPELARLALQTSDWDSRRYYD